MKSILCYGDSLTWGTNPRNDSRHALDHQWPHVMANELGDKFNVVTNALRGRTTAYDDFTRPAERNGAKLLPVILRCHEPLDLVIIMLGTNDLWRHVQGQASSVARGLERLVGQIRQEPFQVGDTPEILLVAPPPMVVPEADKYAGEIAEIRGESMKLGETIDHVAEQLNCHFFDSQVVAKTSALDGVHLDAESSIALGKAMAMVSQKILG